MAEFDTVYLYNPSSEYVEDKWNGQSYFIEPRQIKPMVCFVANNFVTHDQLKEKKKLGLKILSLNDVSLNVLGSLSVDKQDESKSIEKRPEEKKSQKKEKPFADLKE